MGKHREAQAVRTAFVCALVVALAMGAPACGLAEELLLPVDDFELVEADAANEADSGVDVGTGVSEAGEGVRAVPETPPATGEGVGELIAELSDDDSAIAAEETATEEVAVEEVGAEEVVVEAGTEPAVAEEQAVEAGTELASATEETVEATEDSMAAGAADVAREDSSANGSAVLRAQATKVSITKAKVASISKQAYTGKAIKPTPKVTYAGKTLKRGTDYTLSYQSNTKPGTATIVVRGKGSYTGTRRVTFRIVAPAVSYRVHRQTFGWESSWKKNGQTSGTTGQSKRLEGIRIKLGGGFPASGGITYRTHVQSYGWQGWRSNGALSGTTGKSKRLEAIQIKLSGQMASKYDVWYRVHAQTFGWMGWAKNGSKAGTQGVSRRLEAIQIKLVPKGVSGPATSSDNPAFRKGANGKVGWQNPTDYPQVSSYTVQLPSYATGEHTYVTPSRIAVNATREQCVAAFIARAYEYLGTPFREPWAREPGVGIDCSGLVLQCLYACGMDLEHARGTDVLGGYNPYNHYWVPEQTYNSTNWWNNGTFMPVRLADIRRGDLVFYGGHVAIYLGNGSIIHAIDNNVHMSNLYFQTPIGAQRPFV